MASGHTFGRRFGLLDQENFRRWVGSVLPALAKGSVLVVDGQAPRRSRLASQQALHLVSVFATQARLVLGQEGGAEKANELTAMPVLLEALMLKGGIRNRRRLAASSDPYHASLLGLISV